jgi:hypothetical protein
MVKMLSPDDGSLVYEATPEHADYVIHSGLGSRHPDGRSVILVEGYWLDQLWSKAPAPKK